MAQSPFFLFKDPSKVQFSGSTSLTGNQLRGFGGFDPRISIGGSHTAGTGQYTPAGTALRDVFFDGTRVGSTSDRNVFEAPSDQGFSLYSGSTGANSQYQPISRNEVSNDIGMAGVGGPDSPALTIDPRTGRPISSSSTTVTALPGGDDALSTDNTTLTTFQPGQSTDVATGHVTTNLLGNVANPAVDTFINRNFPAEFGQNAGVAFRNLAGDPVARILINGGTPSPEQMAEFRTKFVSEMERLGETATGIVNVLTGGGGAGVLDFFGNRGSTPRFSPEQTLDNLFAELGNTGLTIGPGAGQISLPDILGALGNIGLTVGEGAGQISLPDILSALNIPGLSSDISSGILGGLGGLDEDILKGLDIPGLTSGINAGIQGGITPLTGEDFGIPAIRESLFGEDGLESLIGDLNLDDLASAIGLQGSRISGAGGLSQQLGNLGFNQGFLKTLGTTEDTLGGLTRDLDELGRSEIPGQLNTSLLASQGVLDDILGGSFGGQGFGFPLQQTGLAKALGQGGDLKSLLEGISAPDFTSPLRQAGEINDLFSLGGDLQTNIGAAADRVGPLQQLLQQSGTFGGIADDIGTAADRVGPLQQLLQQSGTFGGIADDIERGAGFADPLNQLAASAQSGAFGDIPRILQEAGVNVSGLSGEDLSRELGLFGEGITSGLSDLSGVFDTRLAGLGTDMSAGFEGINFPDISGLNRIEQQFGNLTGLPASIEKLGQNLPEELRKVIEGEGGFRRGGGGGTTDLTGVNDQLKAILAQLGASDGIQPSGAGGVFEELLQSIRPGFTDIRSQIQKTTADLIAQGASPEDAQRRASEILSSDPVTASILADQERQNELREKEDRELLSRFGVLRGGGTIDLANLRAEDQSRSRLAALGQGAERADKRFQGAIGAGTDIAGLLERRELARAGELGTLDGQRTLSGQDQDQALMGTIISLLQSEFNPNSTKDKQQQALARSLLPLLPPHIRAAFQEILGGA